MTEKNEIKRIRFTDIFKDFPVEIKGKTYKLRYPIASAYYFEEHGIPLEADELKKKFVEKPVYVITHVLYTGLPLEAKKSITFIEFMEEIKEEDIEKLEEFMTKALEAMGFDFSSPYKELEDKQKTGSSEKKEDKKKLELTT